MSLLCLRFIEQAASSGDGPLGVGDVGLGLRRDSLDESMKTSDIVEGTNSLGTAESVFELGEPTNTLCVV